MAHPDTAATPSSEAVLAHLERILASQAFRSSKRSQDFLRYVVCNSLEKAPDKLKERLIGVEVFGREADYDTGQDSIVRVKANEVRRRLAQYYESAQPAAVRFDLSAGSYEVHFQSPDLLIQPAGPLSAPPEAPAASTPPVPDGSTLVIRLPRWLTWMRLTAVLCAAGIALIAAVWLARRPANFDVFWAPILGAGRPVFVCVPTPEAFRIYGSGRDELLRVLQPRPADVRRQIPSTEFMSNVTIIPEPNLFLGLGDARALAQIYSVVGRSQRPLVGLADETTFTQLRNSPAVILGGNTNKWTIELLGAARFRFEKQPTFRIVDTFSGRAIAAVPPAWQQPSREDYGMITRILNSKTGHPILVAAGLNHYGTYAVGEFLSSPGVLGPALEKLPAGWAGRNVQIVFRVEVIRDSVGPPVVVGSHVW